MFQLITPTIVKLMHINVRTEKHGPADVDAFDLDFQIGGENAKVLALLHPDLCGALCFDADDDGGQQTVEGVPPHRPNLRFPKLAEALPWADEATGVDLQVIYGLGDEASNIKLEDGKSTTKKFSIKEGGSATVAFRYSVAGYPDGVIDKLRKKLKQDVSITMVRPERLRQDAVIDGSQAAFDADHPGASAEDLFAAEHGEDPGDELDDDGSGHADIEDDEASKAALDACEDNPFPRAGETETPEREVAADAEETKPRRGRRAAAEA